MTTSPSSSQPIFNTGAVARMTGIPVDTLYAWERRYGFPPALARTAGGRRLYSEQDVILLRRVKARIEEGVSAHQAVLGVQQMEAGGGLAAVQPAVETPVSLSRARLTSALFANDLEAADRMLGESLAFYSPEELTLSFIGPALSETGEAWEEGRISVATEHLASNYLRQRLLMWMVNAPRPFRGAGPHPARGAGPHSVRGAGPRSVAPLILACAPGEWHEGGLLMLGVLLQRQGWPVAYLGQNVPLDDLPGFITQMQPWALVFAAMSAETARALVEWPQSIRQVDGRPLVAYGGRAFVVEPALRDLVPGIYLGDTVEEGMHRLVE